MLVEAVDGGFLVFRNGKPGHGLVVVLKLIFIIVRAHKDHFKWFAGCLQLVVGLYQIWREASARATLPQHIREAIRISLANK